MKYAIKDCDGGYIYLHQSDTEPMLFSTEFSAGLNRSMGIDIGWFSPESKVVEYDKNEVQK